jgi:glycosyltransferase involved in cell wall biosynthesis
MRYAWHGREAYLEAWSNRPLRKALAATLLNQLREWDRSTARRVTQFVAISETIRRRISVCYHRESRVIAPPVDTDFYRPSSQPHTREDFYLVVSALVPYKRIDHAVRACSEIGLRLIVIGAGPERARLESIAGETIQFLGWQTDEVIREHYRRCRALLFPGEEDFGIVPVEAIACGAPVIALGRGGAVETVDDSIGRLYAGPHPSELATAIKDWEMAGCPHDAERGRRKAEAFSVPVFRDRILRLLAEVTTSPMKEVLVPRPHFRISASRMSR